MNFYEQKICYLACYERHYMFQSNSKFNTYDFQTNLRNNPIYYYFSMTSGQYTGVSTWVPNYSYKKTLKQSKFLQTNENINTVKTGLLQGERGFHHRNYR